MFSRVEFGKQEYCHLAVVASTGHLTVWDLLSSRVKWSVSLNLATLTADPLSVYMAVFTTDNTRKLFTIRCFDKRCWYNYCSIFQLWFSILGIRILYILEKMLSKRTSPFWALVSFRICRIIKKARQIGRRSPSFTFWTRNKFVLSMRTFVCTVGKC